MTTAPDPARPATPEDYTKYLDPKALAGARLGVPRKGYFGVIRSVDGSWAARSPISRVPARHSSIR